MPDDFQVPNRGLITLCVMLGNLMQSLDASIANVALPYMQGTLSTSADEITWVLTSYVVAAAIMTAPVGWMAVRFGARQQGPDNRDWRPGRNGADLAEIKTQSKDMPPVAKPTVLLASGHRC